MQIWKIRPGGTENEKIDRQSEQKWPQGHQKWAKGHQEGAKRAPKGSQNSAPGRVRPTAGACWGSVTVCVFPSRMHPFPAVGLVFAVFFFFLGGFHPGSLPFPPLSVVFWSPLGPPLVESGLLFFRYVFWECFLTIFDVFLISFCWVNFTGFSHTCSNCVFAYFSLGCFSNVCSFSKHGIFKKHCFSQVKTLFWRIRLCRSILRISILGVGIVPCFLLNFNVCWRAFRHIFSH